MPKNNRLSESKTTKVGKEDRIIYITLRVSNAIFAGTCSVISGSSFSKIKSQLKRENGLGYT